MLNDIIKCKSKWSWEPNALLHDHLLISTVTIKQTLQHSNCYGTSYSHNRMQWLVQLQCLRGRILPPSPTPLVAWNRQLQRSNSMHWPTSEVDGSFWIRPVIILLHHACKASLSGRSRLLLHISSKRQNDDYLSFKYRFGTIWIESGRASWHISNRNLKNSAHGCTPHNFGYHHCGTETTFVRHSVGFHS
jgi:hypothetical protein